MIGSPDLVAFTKEPDYEDIPIDPFALPEELSVPTYTGDGTPWSKMSIAEFKKDFILLAEFSEQVGPQPLLTVPHETKACGTFDLNHFSLRIMSVDYQTSLTGSGINTPKLNFVEDSKVVLGDSKEGAFSYIHHFTLYDLEARGFVRPFCLAYVSSDENKIIQQLQQLSSEFSKVSECLKTGNRKNFANELETKLRDLEYTRVVLLRETEGDNVMNPSAMYTNEREWTLNDIPTLERETENEKLKEKSLSHKEEVKAQEEAGHPRQKVETRNCILELESENPSNNRSAVLINRTEEQKDKLKDKYCSKPVDKIIEELMNVEKSIQEHNSLLKQVTSYPTRKLRDSEFSPYKPDDLPHSLEPYLDDSRTHGHFPRPVPDCSVITYMNTPMHSPKLINTTSCRRFDRPLKTLEELCDEYFHQQALQQLHSIEKTFRGDASHIYTNHLCKNLLRNLKSTNFLFEATYDSEGAAGLQPGKAASHSSIHQATFLPAPTIMSQPVSLESYTSCVEMVPIKLGLGGSNPSVTLSRTLSGPFDENPPLSSEDLEVHAEIEDNREVSAPDCGHSQDATMMNTSISSGDSIEVLGTEKSFRSQCSSIPSSTAMPKPPPTCTTAAQEGLKQARVPTGRTCSEDSIEVLSTTDSFVPEDLRASYPSAIDEESLEKDTEEKDSSQNQKDKQVECVVEEPHGCPLITLSPPDPAITFHSDDDCHASCTNLSLLEEPCLTVRDDLSDCFSFRSTTASTASDTFSTCIHGDKREGGSRKRCGRMGRAALKFLRQFPFAVHAVFSLLSGRTLVVLGSEEGTVRRLVAALSVYTPHSSSYRESVQPWISTQLQLTDLLNWKLVGFNRMCSPTPGFPHCLGHFGRYISVLDADQKTLRCPTYSGTLINHLVDPRSHIIRGSTYYLFAQSVLGKLVARAFFLTFSNSLEGGTKSRKSTQTLRCHEDLHRDDKKILHYLSEHIKLHFTDVPPNVLQFSYTANSVFKL
ncbi:guanine nucleotide exchange protein smcr8b [Triplophysa dalaica]|uniref:guanine nucleotide exchange protein smcr8b n=1 Tax=Triplophysa dalaica TaxID=1582913 RepID=UPI0024DF8466|nr:guanine nucleotide exchange protein smcr8b [Triplophysa dalaica]